ALPPDAGAQAAAARSALPAVPIDAAAGAAAAAAELRELPRHGPRAAAALRRKVPALAQRAALTGGDVGDAAPVAQRYGRTTSEPATCFGWSWQWIGKTPALLATNSTVLGSPFVTSSSIL